MSITNTKAKSVYNANGTTIEWNLGFTYDDTVSNVHIYIVDANDNETEVTSNYSIADGVLTYPTTASGLEPLAEGNKLVIVRDTPRTQDIELTSNGKLDGKVLEGGYDKLTLQVQELTEQVNRAVKFPVTEDSADNFLDPITAITEAKKEALVEIAQATTPAEVAKDTAVAKAQVATEQATIATNAATSAKAAQVGAEQAEQNATAQAEKAENAVTAFVEGLGTAKNAVIDLGTFDGKTSITSSRIIEFSNTPIAVSLRFSDTNKKLWINGTNSTVGIEVIDNTHCNLFYSIASADFVGQNAVKGPFVVQAIIQYSLLDNSATETEMGAVKLATKAEAEAGTNDTKAMTPLKTKYAIEANATVQTLRNDIDDLGDQVAGIEGKIPADATEQNKLVTKTQMETAVAGSSGFDFEGTKAEFDAAVAAGTITEDSVSLITDDVSGDNVATKAELQDKVSKAGDTMSGTLIFPASSTSIQFGVGSGRNGHYYIKQGTGGELSLYYIDENNVPKGLFLIANETRQPYYYDGTKGYRLLTTADLSGAAGTIDFPNLTAGITFTSPFTAPSDGWISAISTWIGQNDQIYNPFSVVINNVEVYAAAGASRDGRDGYSRDSFYAPLKAGDVVNITRLQVGTFFPMK